MSMKIVTCHACGWRTCDADGDHRCDPRLGAAVSDLQARIWGVRSEKNMVSRTSGFVDRKVIFDSYGFWIAFHVLHGERADLDLQVGSMGLRNFPILSADQVFDVVTTLRDLEHRCHLHGSWGTRCEARASGSKDTVGEQILASNGEVVRREDLEQSARSGQIGIAALAGDLASIDDLHAAIGLTIPVTEHTEHRIVRLKTRDVDDHLPTDLVLPSSAAAEEATDREGDRVGDREDDRVGDREDDRGGEVEAMGSYRPRVVFKASNQGGWSSTEIDAEELLRWALSAEGRAALGWRGVDVDAMIDRAICERRDGEGRPPRA